MWKHYPNPEAPPMKVPDISEEERAEIFTALRERKENLEKLEKKTQEASIPVDRFEERLALYRDRDEFRKAEGGHTEKQLRPGLLAIFAPTPELSTEALENQERHRNGDNSPDLFGGGVETGGGHKPGRRERARGKGGDPQHIGDIIVPPKPREPLGLPAAGTPSNNDNVIDPSPPRPTPEAIAELRQVATVEAEAAESEADPEREALATAAASAHPSGRQIDDIRAHNDTRMAGDADPLSAVDQ
jgi:hypothetical protein